GLLATPTNALWNAAFKSPKRDISSGVGGEDGRDGIASANSAFSLRAGSSSEGSWIRLAASPAASASRAERARMASRMSSSVKWRAAYPPEGVGSSSPSEARWSRADRRTGLDTPRLLLRSNSSRRFRGASWPLRTISRNARTVRPRNVEAPFKSLIRRKESSHHHNAQIRRQ